MLFPLLQADVLDAAVDTVAQAPEAVAPIQPTVMSESLWSMFNMGGPLMWVLLALSILAAKPRAPSPFARSTTTRWPA